MSSSRFEDDFRQDLISLAHRQIFMSGGKRGLDYLLGRGFSKDIIKEWKLGYCPENIGDFILSDTIVIPFYDSHSNLISTSLRRIKNEKPYWWNEVFDKGDYLFGLDKAKYYMSYFNFAILVEGQLDVIALHQHGLKMAVGLSGTFIGEKRFSLLSRYCNRFIIALDNDEAGRTSSQKIFEFLMNKNVYIYKWFLEDNLDPDEYVRKHGAKKCAMELKDLLDEKFKNKKNRHKFIF